MTSVIDSTLPVDTLVMCPFCLHRDKLQRFLISTTKGISHYRAACPECGNGMLIKTLTAEWTPEQFAEWVYPYTGEGFWQKCKFSVFKKRLVEIGWARRFWDRYKELKGEDTTETYEDYIDRKQREEYGNE